MGQDAEQDWFQELYFDDLRASILRIDLTPHFASPYSDDNYNSPSPDGSGPEGQNVRTYTGPADYAREFAGRTARIAVMGPDIEQNLAFFDFSHPDWKTAGTLARLGSAKRAELGDFKLVGSVWSPAPWLKLASGEKVSEQRTPRYPKIGTPWPFIWSGNYAGGRFDASGLPRPEFDDSAMGGRGPTSAIEQFARGLAAEIRGFQRTYGVRFYALSLQNELNFETYYNSCSYPKASDYVAVLKSVRREFDRHADLKPILIMGPEDLLSDVYGMWELGDRSASTHKNLRYLDAVARDPEAAAGLAFFAIHGYADDGVTSAGSQPDQWLRWLDGWSERPARGLPEQVSGFRTYGKKSWMTETSGEESKWLAPDSGFPGQGALGLAIRIHQALVAGQQSAWIYWQFSDGKPVSTMTLTDASLRAESAKYVAAKHFFAPIRPGSRRIETQVSNATDLLASAYLSESDASLVFVIINLSSNTRHLAIELPEFPRAISSFKTWTSNGHSLWRETVVHTDGGRVPLSISGYGVVSLVGTGQLPTGSILGALPDIPVGRQETTGAASRPEELSFHQVVRAALLLVLVVLLAGLGLRRLRR